MGVSINKTSSSQGELYTITILTNKSVKGRKRVLIAMIKVLLVYKITKKYWGMLLLEMRNGGQPKKKRSKQSY